MKTIRTLVFISVLSIGVTQSAFASWWNPFTWFQKNIVSVQQVQQVPRSSVFVAQNTQVQNISSTTEVGKKEVGHKREMVNPVVQNKIPESWRTFDNKQGGVSLSFPKTFQVTDGTEDFVYKSADGYDTKNSEYFSYCDKKLPNQTSSNVVDSCTKGHYYWLGVSVENKIVDKKLIDSWGAEVATSKEITVKGKNAWLIKTCVASGCSVGVKVVHGDKTISLMFYNKFVDESRPMLISELGEQILNTVNTP